MKYKIGDKVRIKSLEWYNENKKANGISGGVYVDDNCFVNEMTEHCGKILTIDKIHNRGYTMKEVSWTWTDGMIEGLAYHQFRPEDIKINLDKKEIVTIEIPEGYEFAGLDFNRDWKEVIVLEKIKNE